MNHSDTVILITDQTHYERIFKSDVVWYERGISPKYWDHLTYAALYQHGAIMYYAEIDRISTGWDCGDCFIHLKSPAQELIIEQGSQYTHLYDVAFTDYTKLMVANTFDDLF